jgi:hypothetical protein
MEIIDGAKEAKVERNMSMTLYVGAQKFGEYKRGEEEHRKAFREYVQLSRIDYPNKPVRLMTAVLLKDYTVRIMQCLYGTDSVDKVEKEIREEAEEKEQCELEENLNACGDDPHGDDERGGDK